MHCFIVFPFLLKYLTSAEYIISSLSVALKPTLMIPITSSAYGVNLDSRMLDKILYAVSNSDMLLQLLQSVLSPFL